MVFTVRHMNVALSVIQCDILCRFALANGQKGDKENRPRESFFQSKILFSDGIPACLQTEN